MPLVHASRNPGPASAPEPIAGGAAPRSGASRHARVLIVEDDSLIAWDLSTHVESLGHRVCGIAASEPEAEAILAVAHPELILMDVNLKHGGNGIDLAGRILASRRLPIIFVTAYGDAATLARIRALPETRLLLKPVGADQLAQAIAAALA